MPELARVLKRNGFLHALCHIGSASGHLSAGSIYIPPGYNPQATPASAHICRHTVPSSLTGRLAHMHALTRGPCPDRSDRISDRSPTV